MSLKLKDGQAAVVSPSTKSCEDENTRYLELPDGLRLIFCDDEYVGWYLPEGAADVAEVVRCKDCVHGEMMDGPVPTYLCLHCGSAAHEEDHYCSYGKRKEEADER